VGSVEQKLKPLVMGEYLNAFGVIRSLGLKGLRCYGVSARRGMAQYSRYVKRWFFVPDPVVAPEECVRRLLQIAQAIGPVLMYPSNWTWVNFLAKYKPLLGPACVVPLPEAEILDRCNTRVGLNEAARAAGLSVPKTMVWDARGPLLEAIGIVRKEMQPPIFVKTVDQGVGVAFVGYTRVFHSHDSLEVWARRIAEIAEQRNVRLVFQERAGSEEGELVSVQGYVSRRGRLLAATTYRKYRQHPPENGAALCAVVDSDAEVITASEAICRFLEYRGLFDADFIRDRRSGELYCLDLNPRTGMLVYGSTVAGVNLPWLQYADYAGIPVAAEDLVFKGRCVWWRVLGDVVYYVLEGRRYSRLGLSDYIRTLQGRKAWGDIDPADIRPGLYEIARLPLRLLPGFRRVD